jgi:predicted Zn-dependent protease with MMP-like domain
MAKRARGSVRRRRVRVGSAARFDELVQRALDSIPEPFARALDEVAIVIDDEPSRQQLRESGLGPDEGLYGLYEGIPRTEYAADWAFVPNKITLFAIPLVEDFPDPAELEHEVWITVIHELAHHLGIEESRLHDLGVD